MKQAQQKGFSALMAAAPFGHRAARYASGALRIALYEIQQRLPVGSSPPLSLTLCPSYACNSRCQTCFLWKHPSQPELTLQEWRRVILSLGHSPLWMTLSGGEPFLNDDLVPLVRAIARDNRPLFVNIPTNGLLPERITEATEEILGHAGGVVFLVNFSLDGVGQDHDRIRGVKGSFAKFTASFESLRGLQARHHNLFVGINTTISRFNVEHCAPLFELVRQLNPDSFIAEIADERQELENLGAGIKPSARDSAIALELMRTAFAPNPRPLIPELIRGIRRRYYRFAQLSLTQDEEILPCNAGVASAYIDPHGTVWPCCRMVPAPLGSLRGSGCDFMSVWNSPTAQQTRARIRADRCRCTNPNNFYTNCLLSPLAAWSRLR